jgi:hypothetical protein
LHECAPIDLKDKVLEKVDKEVLEEEELENLFFKNICSEIMEEVIDIGSDYGVILPRGQTKKKNHMKRKKI